MISTNTSAEIERFLDSILAACQLGGHEFAIVTLRLPALADLPQTTTEAMVIFQVGLAIDSEKFPGNFAVQAEVLDTIGETFESIGKYDRAVEFVDASTQIRQEWLGHDHPDFLASMTNLIFVNLSADKPNEAISLFCQVIDKVDQAQNRSTPDTDEKWNRESTAPMLDALIAVLDERFDPSRFTLKPIRVEMDSIGTPLKIRILATMGKVIGIRDKLQKHYGLQDKRTAVFHFLVGLCQEAIGDQENAIEIYQDVLISCKSELGENDLRTCGLKLVLGMALKRQNDSSEEAISMLKQGAESIEEQIGTFHPASQIASFNLAMAYADFDRADDALELLKRIGESSVSTFGNRNRFSIKVKTAIFTQLEQLMQLDEATQVAQQVLKLQNELQPRDQIEISQTRFHLASLFEQTKQTSKAREQYLVLLNDDKQFLGASHGDTLVTLNNLALLYEKNGKLNQALDLYGQILEVLRKENKLPMSFKAILYKNLTRAFMKSAQNEKDLQEVRKVVRVWLDEMGERISQTKKRAEANCVLSDIEASLGKFEAATKAATLALKVKHLQRFNLLRCRNIIAFSNEIQGKTAVKNGDLYSSFALIEDEMDTIPEVEQYIVIRSCERMIEFCDKRRSDAEHQKFCEKLAQLKKNISDR